MELNVNYDTDDYWQQLIDNEEEKYDEMDRQDEDFAEHRRVFNQSIEEFEKEQTEIEDHERIIEENNEWIQWRIAVEVEHKYGRTEGFIPSNKSDSYESETTKIYSTYQTVEQKDCSICFGTFEKNSTFCKTKCNHHFCHRCTTKWFNEKSKITCPYCNQIMSSI